MNYHQYIHSEAWRETKKRFYKSKLVKRNELGQPFCFSCKRSDMPLDVHHKTYKTLGKERLMDLALLCRECHNLVHELHKMRPQNGLWNASNKIIRSRYHYKRMVERHRKARISHAPRASSP